MLRSVCGGWLAGGCTVFRVDAARAPDLRIGRTGESPAPLVASPSGNTCDVAAVAIVGADRAGKTTAAQLLMLEFVAVHVEFGDYVKAHQHSDPSLPADTSTAYLELRERHGSSLLALWALAALKSVAHDEHTVPHALIMSGVRDQQAFTRIIDTFSNLIVVTVTAPRCLRFSRQGKDGRAPLSEAAFTERDRLHDDWGLQQLQAHTTIVLPNAGSLDELETVVRTQVVPVLKERGFVAR